MRLTNPACQVNLLSVETVGALHVAPPPGHAARGIERAQPGGRLTGIAHGEDPGHRRPAFVDVAASLPVTPQRGCEAHRDLWLAAVDRPVDHRPKVVVVLVEAVQHGAVMAALQARLDPLGQGQVHVGVAAANRVRLAAHREAVGGEHADRRDRRKRAPSREGAGWTRLCSTRTERPSITSMPRFSAGPQTVSASRTPSPPANTDSRSRRGALRIGKEVVAPGDRRLQRALSRWSIA